MIFNLLITCSLLLTAGTSAFMSVYGLISVFSNFAIVVGCMGSGLELGKILIVVYIHRTWSNLRLSHKAYYVLVVFFLTALTSFEIIGFLSQAHTESIKGVDVRASQIASLEAERGVIREELSALEKTLSELPPGYVSKRLKARKDAGYYQLRARLRQIEGELGVAGETRIMAQLEAGPIVAISRIFGVDGNVAILIFILALVGVVEPLSIGLTVAVSSVWSKPKPMESPVVDQPKQNDQKVGKMSKSHVERIQRKLARKQGIISPEDAERKFKGDRST